MAVSKKQNGRRSVSKGKVSSESRGAMFVIKEHFMRKRKTGAGSLMMEKDRE